MPSDQQRQDGMIVSATVLTAVSGVFMLIRLMIRCLVIRKPGWDDLTITAAYLAAVAYVIELYYGKANHIGFPMTTLTYENMVELMKITLAIEITYYITVSLIKISILLMYLRFGTTYALLLMYTANNAPAVEKWFRRLTLGTLIFHTIFFFVCVIVTTNQCMPLNKWWDLTRVGNENCIDTTAFFYCEFPSACLGCSTKLTSLATSGINILTDFWILGLPICTLRKINRPSKEKFALLAVFGVGCFGCITSIIRLKSIKTYTKAKDPFRSSLAVNVWSMIEINVAMLCASIPALKPLFTPRRLIDTIRNSKGISNSGSGNIRTQNWVGYNRSGSGSGMDKGPRSIEDIVLETKASSNVAKSSMDGSQGSPLPSPFKDTLASSLEGQYERGRPILSRLHESMESIIREAV
ncbi:hypothetical protein TD95_004284 [Thielaviopsis punctulata]|uniref:Rhodopsin domain-containing protein n=1 Tax=Thielaviopsis punctulata TaxID=72032 RepID=A0A0F4ZDF4_9PEZI|nr:hypothetical protein TD95_004284 [Thielaviopsis punctulata]